MLTAYDFIRIYSLEELKSMTPVRQGQYDFLMLEIKGEWRLWFSKMTKEDDAKDDNEVYVELFNTKDGRWEKYNSYFAR